LTVSLLLSFTSSRVSARKNGAGQSVNVDDMPVKYHLLISQVEENWRQAM